MVTLPRPSAKFLPYMADTYWLPAAPSSLIAALAADLEALIVAAQHEVDDARDGVRTVNGRVAARHDVDALDQVVRDRVDVHRHGVVENVARDVAAAVDQHQGALRAEAAKIEQVEAGDADAEARILLGEGRAQLRQLVQDLTDIGVALLEESGRR